MAFAIVSAAFLDVLLLISGRWVLLKEQRGEEYTPYSRYVLPEKIGDTLACTYFTGRSLQTVQLGAYDQKPPECPFIVNSRA